MTRLMMTRHTFPILFTVSISAAACASTPPGARPYDNSAAGHRREAEQHQTEADHTLQSRGSKAYYQQVHLHKQLAAAHLRAAERLDAEVERLCEGRSADADAVWSEISDTDTVLGGAVLHLSPEVGTAKDVLAQLRCHRATVARGGFASFPDDPLAIDGLDIIVHDEPTGIAVMFGVDGEGQVRDLRRRVELIAAK